MKRALALLVLLAGCQTATPTPVMSGKSAVELRAMESRLFQTADRRAMLRTVIATVQDLGYSIDKVAAGAGTVTATKLARLVLTVSLYPQGETATVVRANAMIALAARTYQVDDPVFYQKDFFDPLAHALVLEALPAPPDAAGSAAAEATAPGGTNPGGTDPGGTHPGATGPKANGAGAAK